MSLSNSQYNAVMRVLQQRRLDAEWANEERLRTLYEENPALRSVENRLHQAKVAMMSEKIAGNMPAAQAACDSVLELTQEREDFLVKLGLDRDFAKPRYSCSVCSDTGFSAPGVKCQCFMREAIKILYKNQNIDTLIGDDCFDRIDMKCYPSDVTDSNTGLTILDEMTEVIRECKDFAQNFDTRSGMNLMLQGPVGTGKTMLTHCIARELLDRCHSVVILSSQGLADLLRKRSFENSENDSASDTGSFLYESDLLIIDDLGMEKITEFYLANLFDLINRRLTDQKSVIITTNLSLENLRDMYSERIYSRIFADYEMIHLTGSDLRIRNSL